MLVGAALAGCVAQPVSQTTSSDLAAYRAQLEVPDWLAAMDPQEISDLVDQAIETPIAFYGRVVDTQGEPVPDARVSFAVFDTRLEPFEFPYVGWTLLPDVNTGRDGSFELVDVNGSSLYVRVEKAGWKAVGNSKRHLRYSEQTQHMNRYRLPTEAEPMVFELTPGLPLEDYYYIHSGAVLIPRDGREIEYRLDTVNPYGVPAGEGDLAVSCDKGSVRADGRWDWSCTIRMTRAGGGIQLQREIVLEQAPEAGYMPAIEISMAADDPNWDHRADRFTYVSLREGHYYGHLTFRIRTDGDYYFDIDGMVNVTGSRELETLYSVSD